MKSAYRSSILTLGLLLVFLTSTTIGYWKQHTLHSSTWNTDTSLRVGSWSWPVSSHLPLGVYDVSDNIPRGNQVGDVVFHEGLYHLRLLDYSRDSLPEDDHFRDGYNNPYRSYTPNHQVNTMYFNDEYVLHEGNLFRVSNSGPASNGNVFPIKGDKNGWNTGWQDVGPIKKNTWKPNKASRNANVVVHNGSIYTANQYLNRSKNIEPGTDIGWDLQWSLDFDPTTLYIRKKYPIRVAYRDGTSYQLYELNASSNLLNGKLISPKNDSTHVWKPVQIPKEYSHAN